MVKNSGKPCNAGLAAIFAQRDLLCVGILLSPDISSENYIRYYNIFLEDMGIKREFTLSGQRYTAPVEKSVKFCKM